MKPILLKGDCLEMMNHIPDGSIDMVLTDPPYNISVANNYITMGRRGIDFGEWDKDADLFSYIDSVFRILTTNGSFVVFNAWKNLGDIARYCENLGFKIKDLIRLEKSNPMPRNINRRYVVDYEFAIWFTMPKAKWIFNRQDKKYERPKFIASCVSGVHPTQKNLKLIEWLIKIHTNKEDVICDPFMGSGTTGVACKNLNRNFIGIELDAKYFEIAKDRIENAGTN